MAELTATHDRKGASNHQRRVWTGLTIWGTGALLVAGTELAAVFHGAPWPTISATTGHLEDRWPPIALLVVFLIVYAAYCVAPRPSDADALNISAVDKRRHTPGGRRPKNPLATPESQKPGDGEFARAVGYCYVSVALLATAGAITTATIAQGDQGEAPFVGAYILYGVIAIMWIVVPSLLAYFWSKDVPFPTFVWTLHVLYRHRRFLAIILLAALTILLIHLALYPWPSIIHDLQHSRPTKQSP